MTRPISVLFVCLGNICRSPTAEAVMRRLVAERGLGAQVEVDSAGTIGFHAGRPSDPRTAAAGRRRGYDFGHRARQVTAADLGSFDYVVAMDRANLADLKALGPARAELSLLLDHCAAAGNCEVPDPYHGGPEGFDRVIDLAEAGCTALLDQIVKRHALRPVT